MAAGLPPDPPLDTSIARGQAGLREDAEVVHGTLALLREAAGKTVAELAADDAFTGTFAQLGIRPSPFGVLRSVLAAGDDPVTLGVLGDSTGEFLNEWPYESVGAFAADYPAYSAVQHLWDDIDQSYSERRSIQVGADGEARFVLDGTGDFLTTADSAVLDIVGDLDIRIKVAMTDWTPAALSVLAAKFSVGQQSWRLYVNTSGTLTLQWTENGSTSKNLSSTVAPAATDGQPLWIWVTLDVDNGATGHDVKYHTSPDGLTWTQLGATRTGSGVTSVFAGTSTMQLGTWASGSDPLAGAIYYFELRNGIDGTVVSAVEPGLWAYGTTVRGVTGETWSFLGDAHVEGSPAMVLLNASAPGKTLSYSNDATRFAKQTPIPMALAFINYGHNDGASVTLASDYATLADAIRSKYAQCAVIATLQNPQTAPRTDAQVAAQRRAMTLTVPGVAAARSLPVVDAYSALSADTATYIDTDGVHPTTAGQDVWRDVVLDLLRTA